MKITSCSLKEFQIVWLLLSLRLKKSEIFCFHFATKALQTFSTVFVWKHAISCGTKFSVNLTLFHAFVFELK